jgi:CHASE2 domain-containing sensor protein
MKNIWVLSLAITIFIFLMLWGVSYVTDLKFFSAFDPIGQALSDFELTDYSFSKLREDPTVDPRIVLVNFGNLPRRDVAQQIQIINQYKPKIIGIDGYYNCEGGFRDSVNCPQLLDTLGNLMLSNAIAESGNVVLVSKLLQSDSMARANAIDVYDSIEYSDLPFREHAKNAFANLVSGADFQEDVKLCRSFNPKIKVSGKDEYAFAVQICMLFDSVKTKKFLARNKEEEIINYRGNVEIQDIRLKNLQRKSTATTNYPIMFYAIDVDQIAKGEVLPEMFKDNIVILGFLGEHFGDATWIDKWFTPLNKKVAGRANPDMFGVVVHANIIAMILNEDYVNELAEWEKYAIAFIVCFLTVALFIRIDTQLPAWFDALQVLIQVAQILLLSGLIVYTYVGYSFKLDLGITLGVAALVGPAYDIFKSIQNELIKRFTKPAADVLNNT